ncbi:MAG TPA: hypothetical protein DHV86_07505 [Methylophilaceae bacterium]|nr:hypothetical protein [Methylophilaceae bacterium]
MALAKLTSPPPYSEGDPAPARREPFRDIPRNIGKKLIRKIRSKSSESVRDQDDPGMASFLNELHTFDGEGTREFVTTGARSKVQPENAHNQDTKTPLSTEKPYIKETKLEKLPFNEVAISAFSDPVRKTHRGQYDPNEGVYSSNQSPNVKDINFQDKGNVRAYDRGSNPPNYSNPYRELSQAINSDIPKDLPSAKRDNPSNQRGQLAAYVDKESSYNSRGPRNNYRSDKENIPPQDDFQGNNQRFSHNQNEFDDRYNYGIPSPSTDHNRAPSPRNPPNFRNLGPSPQAPRLGEQPGRPSPGPNEEIRHILGNRRSLRDVLEVLPYNDFLYDDDDVQTVLNSHLGSIAFQNWLEARVLSRQDINPRSILRFCRDYAEGKRNENRALDDKLQALEAKIECMMSAKCKSLASEQSAALLNKLFYNPNTLLGVSTPKDSSFSEGDTLHNRESMTNAVKYFPVNKRWRGSGNCISVQAFLEDMTNAQNICKLSREEFNSFLKRCSDGEARIFFDQLLLCETSISELYKEIISQFDELITPQEAENRAVAYKAAKGTKLTRVLADIRMYITRAASFFSTPELSSDYINQKAPACIISALPFDASQKAMTTLRILQRELNKTPTFDQFAKALRIEEDILNREIEKYGVDSRSVKKATIGIDKTTHNKHDNSNKFKNRGGHSNAIGGVYEQEDEDSDSYKQDNLHATVNAISYNRNSYHQPEKRDYHVTNGSNDRNECLLCGQFNHKPADLCLCMIADSGKVIEQQPTSLPCKTCKDKMDISLYHASTMCPLREKALYLYKKGEHSPRGPFRKYLIAQKMWTPPDRSNQNKYKNNKAKPYVNNKSTKPQNKKGYTKAISCEESNFDNSDIDEQDDNTNDSDDDDNDSDNDDFNNHYSNGSTNCIQSYVRAISNSSISSLISDSDTSKNKCFLIDTKIGSFTSKLYLNFKASQFKYKSFGTRTLTAMIDTGSDSCLITRSYLGRAFNMNFDEIECYLNKSKVKLYSFTNHSIEISGSIDLLVNIPLSDLQVKLKFLVVNDIGDCLSPLIIGLAALGQLNLCLEYRYFASRGKEPVLFSKTDDKQLCLSLFLSDSKLQELTGYVSKVKPGEKIFCPFYLEHFHGYGHNDDVLITEDKVAPNINPKFIEILPTKSILKFDHKTNKLKGMACVINHGPSLIFDIFIKGTIEPISNYTLNQIDLSNIQNLTTVNFIHQSPNHVHHKFSEPLPVNSIKVKEIKTSIDLAEPTLLVSNDVITSIPEHVYSIQTMFPSDSTIRPCPNTINNGMGNKVESLTDSRHKPLETHTTSDGKDTQAFNDPAQACQLGLKTYDEDEDFIKNVSTERGYEIPKDATAKDLHEHIKFLVNIDQYPKEIAQHVKSIFIDKYSSLVATSSLQRGNMSQTLGKYEVKLKDNIELPKHKKIYYLAPLETRQLQSILEYLIKSGTISKAKSKGDIYNEFSSPGYLIPRSKPDSSPRLIVNFQSLNKCIQAEPAVLPTIDAMINDLRNAYLFSVVDLSNAFYSIEITDKSKPLTAFTCALGSFFHNCLPTGIRTSPEALNRIVAKAIHYLPVLDTKGNQQFNADGELVMKHAPIKNCFFIYDDILTWSPPMSTYAESIKLHFDIFGEVMRRLAYHQCKLSVHKSQICKTKVNFFGYYIRNGFVMADPKRIDKIIKAPPPTTPKMLRSYLGVINSMRSQLGFEVLSHTAHLTELTNGKLKKFDLTGDKLDAFNNIKTALTQGPIFSKIIDLTAPKLIFSDMSGADKACYSAVLCQVIYPKKGEITVPTHLSLLDPTHVILYDNKILARPLTTRKTNESIDKYLRRIENDPPTFDYLDSDTFGYSKEDVNNSLGLSLQLALDASKCVFDYNHICKQISSIIRGGLDRYSYLDFIFNQDRKEFDNFINLVNKGILTIDKKLFIFGVLGEVLYRPIVVISGIPEFKPITEFNSSKTKPPIYFLLYKTKDGLFVVKPALADKISSYKLSNFRGTLEIVSYVSKVIAQKERHLHIIDLELQGILFALSSFRKLIGNCEAMLLTDSQALFYLFNSINLASNKKITRWNFQIIELLPQLVIKHVVSCEQLADFLTRQYKVDDPPIKKLQLLRFKDEDYNNLVPDITFTFEEWEDFVNKHKDFIFTSQDIENNKETIGKVRAIKATPQLKAISIVKSPVQIFKSKLDPELILKEQKLEYKDLINHCNSSADQSFVQNNINYKMINGNLCVITDDTIQLLCPTSLLPTFIAYTHVITNHGGEAKIRLNLQNLYHKNLIKLVREYTRSCYGCQIVNVDTHPNNHGLFPIPPKPFHTILLDYVQSLPKFRGYEHVLVATCYLTGAIYCFPTTSLSHNEFMRVYLTNINQILSPKQIMSDNGSVFINKETLIFFAALGVHVHHTTSHSPKSKGSVEKANHIVKSSLKKIIGNKRNYNWMYILPLITNQYNSTKIAKHGMAPLDLVFGTGTAAAQKHFEMLPENKLHPLIGSEYAQVMNQHKLMKSNLEIIKKSIQDARVSRLDRINKTKTDKRFEPDMLVLIKNFSNTVGTSRTLKPYYHPCPYRIINVSPVSILAQRIADNLVIKIHNDDAKAFKTPSEEFKTLSPLLQTVLNKSFHELTDREISEFVQNETYEIPTQAIPFNIRINNEPINFDIDAINTEHNLIQDEFINENEAIIEEIAENDDIDNIDNDYDHYELEDIKRTLRANPKKTVSFPNIVHNTKSYD